MSVQKTCWRGCYLGWMGRMEDHKVLFCRQRPADEESGLRRSMPMPVYFHRMSDRTKDRPDMLDRRQRGANRR